MNGGLEITLNEAANLKLRYHLSVRLQGLMKTTIPSVRIADILAEIRIEHLLNTSLERHDYTHLFGPSHVF